MRFACVALSVLCASSVFGEVYEPGELSRRDIVRDSSLLINVMNDIHPGYDRYLDVDQRKDAERMFKQEAKASGNSDEFYVAVARYLAKIRCEHTEAELPPSSVEWRGDNDTMIPLVFDMEDGRAIVTASADKRIEFGDELVSVNGVAVADFFEQVGELISVDGLTDHTKVSVFESADDIGLTTFDVFWPLFYGFADSYVVELVDRDGAERVVDAEPIGERESLKMRGAKKNESFGDPGTVGWEDLGDGDAYLSVNTFVNYRKPIDPAEVFGPIFEEINASGCDRLILDLRECGGGSDDVQTSLIQHIIDEAVTIGGERTVKAYRFNKYRENLNTWDEQFFDLPAQLFTKVDGGMYSVSDQLVPGIQRLDPAADAWGDELIVLMGHNNASAATMMLAELRHQREMTYIGRPSGGSAEGPNGGVYFDLTLPGSGVVVRVPMIRHETAAVNYEFGMGVAPDVEVNRSVETIREGVDLELDVARGM